MSDGSRSTDTLTPLRRRIGRRIGQVRWAGLLLAFAACAHPDVIIAPSGAASDFFASLTVQERAINMALTAPDDTLRLHVNASMADGTPVGDRPTYTPNDSTVTVDSLGLVTARYVNTNPAYVTVSLKHIGVTRSIVVPVQVRATRPATQVRKILLRPSAGAGAYIPMYDTNAVNGQMQLEIVALDANDARIDPPAVVLSVRSSDSTIATIDSTGLVNAQAPGHVTLYVSSVVYGTPVFDSLPFAVIYPQSGQDFTIYGPSVSPTSPYSSYYAKEWKLDRDTMRVSAGGKVGWTNEGTVFAAVVFDDPTNVFPGASGYNNVPGTAGNIDPFGAGSFDMNVDYSDWVSAHDRARVFPVAGAYPFTVIPSDPSVTTRPRGVVIVCPDSSIMTCNAP